MVHLDELRRLFFFTWNREDQEAEIELHRVDMRIVLQKEDFKFDVNNIPTEKRTVKGPLA